MISKDFFLALEDLEREKGVSKEVFIQELENALACACKKQLGEATNVPINNAQKEQLGTFRCRIMLRFADQGRFVSLRTG